MNSGSFEVMSVKAARGNPQFARGLVWCWGDAAGARCQLLEERRKAGEDKGREGKEEGRTPRSGWRRSTCVLLDSYGRGRGGGWTGGGRQ